MPGEKFYLRHVVERGFITDYDPRRDIADGLRMHRNEVVEYVEELTNENVLEGTWTKGPCYYGPAQRE